MKKKAKKSPRSLESGRNMLKDAKKKYLLPSYKALNKFAIDSKYTIRLTYLPFGSSKKTDPVEGTGSRKVAPRVIQRDVWTFCSLP